MVSEHEGEWGVLSVPLPRGMQSLPRGMQSCLVCVFPDVVGGPTLEAAIDSMGFFGNIILCGVRYFGR